MLHAITDDNFQDEVIGNPLPSIIEFTAGWCTLCEKVEPVMEKLSDEYEGRLRFCTANTDTEKRLRIKFGVAALPFIVLVQDGERVPLFDELVTEERLRERIDYVLGGGDAPRLPLRW